LFDPPSSKFLVLNGTGSYLWERLSEPQSADDLARAVCGRFSGVQWATALQDVNQILEELVSHDLVVRSEAIAQS